jgi:catechol 2,3-dioxygenase
MYKLKKEIEIEEVGIKVLNLKEVLNFYQKILGFEVVELKRKEALLGSKKFHFLRILEDKKVKKEKFNDVGLYHVAYRVKDRETLAIVLEYLIENKAPIDGFADHLVSEAIYLHDIEGNGIEIYCDKPKKDWPGFPDKIEMGTLPLDVDSLLKLAKKKFTKIDKETRIGHIHLKVSNLEKTEEFYTKALGLDLTLRYFGAIFLSSGGYHHHIGANIWQSLGATPRKDEMAGFNYFVIKLPSKEDFEKIVQNLKELSIEHKIDKNKIKLRDPDNLNLILKI